MGTKHIRISNKREWSSALLEARSFFILLALILLFVIIAEGFVNPVNLINMVKRQSYVAVVAFAATFVITLAGLDLSIGSIAAVVGVSFALMLPKFSANFGIIGLIAAVVTAIIIGGLCGLINGYISVKGKITPFLVTLATMFIFRSIAIVLSGSKEISIMNNVFTKIFSTGKLFGIIPSPVIILILMFALSWFLFERSKYGYYVKAIGGNEEAARVSGINITKVKIWTYTLSGLFAAVSGLMLAGLYTSGSPGGAIDLALDAIAAVILGGTAIAGGTGKIWGTLTGILILAVITNGMTLFGAMFDIQILVKGMIIILAVLLDNFLSQKAK